MHARQGIPAILKLRNSKISPLKRRFAEMQLSALAYQGISEDQSPAVRGRGLKPVSFHCFR